MVGDFGIRYGTIHLVYHTVGRQMFIWGIFGIILATTSSIEMFMVARVGIGIGLGAQVPTTTTKGMLPSEYDDLIEKPYDCILEKVIHRQFKALDLSPCFTCICKICRVSTIFPMISWR